MIDATVEMGTNYWSIIVAMVDGKSRIVDLSHAAPIVGV